MIPARLLIALSLACLVGLSACSSPEPVAENQPVQPAAPPVPQEPSTPPLPAEQLAVGQLQDVNFAIEFVEAQRDAELWQQLINHSLKNSTFFIRF